MPDPANFPSLGLLRKIEAVAGHISVGLVQQRQVVGVPTGHVSRQVACKVSAPSL